MAVSCSLCGSGELHLSRFRGTDLGQLFKLRIPVRCYTCLHREYVSIFERGNLKPGKKHRRNNSSHTHGHAES